MFSDIMSSVNWYSSLKISKGWSNDEKYQILTKDGEKQLLRLSSIEE